MVKIVSARAKIAAVIVAGVHYRTVREAHSAHARDYYGHPARVLRRDGSVEVWVVGGAWPTRQPRVLATDTCAPA